MTLVIPCYNEVSRLHFKEFLSFVGNVDSVDILFVNDGSTDDTEKALRDMCGNSHLLRFISLQKNVGKAEAIRTGFMYALRTKNPDFIGYLDADLATPLDEILMLKSVLQQKAEKQMVFGSRWSRLGSTIERRAIRHYIGRVFVTIANSILSFHIYDTQCGAKIFRSEMVFIIFSRKFYSRWLFDLEILCRYRLALSELPMSYWGDEIAIRTWRDIGKSKIRIIDIFQAPYDLIRIWWYYKILNFQLGPDEIYLMDKEDS